MSKFVKGQKVRIKDDLIVGKWYGDCEFVENMMKYRGEYATIKEVDEDGDYRIDGTIFWWSDEMLERLSCANCIDCDKSPDERPCCDCSEKSLFKPRNTNTFEVGDLVRIKDNLVIGKKYGNLTYISNMNDYKGRVYRVSKISKEGNYTLSNTNPFYWSGDMLESVIDCEDIKEDRLEVNAPTVAELEKTIVETVRLILDNYSVDDLSVNDLSFMNKISDACCKHKLYRTMLEGGREDGNRKD